MDPAAGTGGFLLVAHEFASEGVEDLTAALAEFEAVTAALEQRVGSRGSAAGAS